MTYAGEQNSALSSKTTVLTLKQKKANGEKFASIALYDAATAALAQKAGVDIVLVGDSLGMTVLGFDSTLPVTMEQMVHHVAAVSRGNQKSLIMGDLPFMSYATPEQAIQNAARLMQAGAHMVKLEGGAWLLQTVQQLCERGIPVCAHLGLTPQSVNKFGGYKVQGRDRAGAEQIARDAELLAQAGADALILECVPTALAKSVTERLNIPTIGIGAGHYTDGQVLVINDLLGMTENPPRFAKNFLLETQGVVEAFARFVRDVRSGQFPAEEHGFK